MSKMRMALYNKFREDVLDNMKVNDMITRNQIMYKMNITDKQVDELLMYIKFNLCIEGFNCNTMIGHEGFRVEFLKSDKLTKMIIIKL